MTRSRRVWPGTRKLRPRTGWRPSSHAQAPPGHPHPCGSRPGAWPSSRAPRPWARSRSHLQGADHRRDRLRARARSDPNHDAVHLHLDPPDGPRPAGAPRLRRGRERRTGGWFDHGRHKQGRRLGPSRAAGEPAPSEQLRRGEPVPARHPAHCPPGCVALSDDGRLLISRPGAPPTRPGEHLKAPGTRRHRRNTKSR